MSLHAISFGLAESTSAESKRLLTLLAVVSMLVCTAAAAQDAPDTKEVYGLEEMSKLYDCSSFYALVNYCYSRDRSEASQRISVLTSQNRDKVIHLIYLNAKRSNILPETSQKDMLTSFNNMMNSIDAKCENIGKPIAIYRASCDKIIEDVPKQPYDQGKKSG